MEDFTNGIVTNTKSVDPTQDVERPLQFVLKDLNTSPAVWGQPCVGVAMCRPEQILGFMRTLRGVEEG